MNKPDILERLADLHKQATTERSHYYTAAVITDARTEIVTLRRALKAARPWVKAMWGLADVTRGDTTELKSVLTQIDVALGSVEDTAS